MKRLSHELIESHNDFSNTVLVGLQPRGIHVVTRLKSYLETILGKEIQCGNLDITFYRDDFRRRERPLIPSVTNIDFVIEGKKVILIDDVLYTGRTIRSGLDALMAFAELYKATGKTELALATMEEYARLQEEYYSQLSADHSSAIEVMESVQQVETENELLRHEEDMLKLKRSQERVWFVMYGLGALTLIVMIVLIVFKKRIH